MILEYPRADIEVITTVILNVTQMAQLREQIAATQNTALMVGLLIGGVVGAIGVIAAWYYLSSKRFA